MLKILWIDVGETEFAHVHEGTDRCYVSRSDGRCRACNGINRPESHEEDRENGAIGLVEVW
jgi:hypothetical protein